MSKLMMILGIAVTAAAIAVGLLLYFSPGQMQVLGITPEGAAILLVGGLSLFGLGGVIAALDRGAEATVELRRSLALDRGTGEFARAAQASGIAAATVAASPEPSPSEQAASEAVIAVSTTATSETIAALDKAKEELTAALAEPSETAEEEPEEEAEETAEESEGEGEQLYVVEERLIRGRPARVLSDGTVEAETDEGWMRFENREHLEEYLDAMSPERS